MAEAEGRVKTLWEVQARRIALWTPVCIGFGALLWFEAPGLDAPFWAAGLIAAAWAVAAAFARRSGAALAAMLCFGAALIALGYAAAEGRYRAVDAPVLITDFSGAAQGRVVRLDRSRSGAPRVVLDRVALAGLAPGATPERVRITLSGTAASPALGARIAVKARLSPPPGPAAPGAFDFSRRAFFLRLGAIGYARGGFDLLAPPASPPSARLRLERLRADIAEALRARIDGREGAVAAALAVGDRSGIPPETLQALRDSGLAHLLAISGLHIGLMGALAFWVVRLVLAAVPGCAERFPIRKAAAVAALLAAGTYLALSGASVATQRAFVMAAVAFGAILIDRPAITARGLALAACVVLLMRPESLYDAGFQMSFSAAAALVAGYEASRGFWRKRALKRGLGARFWTMVLGTLATSLLAGLATAPYAAFHFNRVAAFGLLANILAVPVMGVWIMPALIACAALALVGAPDIAAPVLGAGVGYVLWVADAVAGLEGAVGGVASGPSAALLVISLGGLWLVIWRGWLRAAGLAGVIAGVWVWAAAPRPDLLIAPDADLIAGRDADARLWISREKAESYTAELWLRREGEFDVSQLEAHDRAPWRCDGRRCVGESAGRALVLVYRGALEPGDCAPGALMIAPRALAPSGPCAAMDALTLADDAALAVFFGEGDVFRIEAVRRWRRKKTR